MANTKIRNGQILDGTIERVKLVADFLNGSNWNISDGNNNATITGLADGVGNNDAVNVQQLNAAIAALTGVKTLRGPLAGGSDLTGNSTGNTYIDNTTDYKAGDVFQISSDGVITVSDGTLAVNNGDEIVILNDASEAGIVLADLFKIDNTEATDILRTGNIEDSLTSSSTSDVLSANQGLVLKGLIDVLNQFETEEFTAATPAQTFTLTNAPLAGLKNRMVYLNGLRLSSGEYTIAGAVLTITAPTIIAGDCVVVDYRY